MSLGSPKSGSLVLYKSRPARVSAVSDKLELELEQGKSRRVRPKDVELLHPGPLGSLGALQAAVDGNPGEAWELLQGEQVSLAELAELVFGEFSPATAWASWQLLEDGLLFHGSLQQVEVRTEDEVARLRAERETRAQEEQSTIQFLDNLKQGRLAPEDHPRLEPVERFAHEQLAHCPLLKTLDLDEQPAVAHRLLRRCGYWDAWHNPYPRRLGASLLDPGLPEDFSWSDGVERRDLTALDAYAIDDAGSQDPDDAISFDYGRIWVHVADVGSLVPPDGDLDLIARDRAANLYLPEQTVHMLPPELTHRLALGLADESPALSIGFRLDEQGTPCEVEITPSKVRVSRHSYAEMDPRLQEPDIARLVEAADRYRQRREAAGAVTIDLPEVGIRLVDGEIALYPLVREGSRALVTELMLMAGEAVALFAHDQRIPLPFVAQKAPDDSDSGEGLAGMYSLRRRMRPARAQTVIEPHAGLGLALYSRATSPLRRYLDLVTHQQLHAHLAGRQPLDSKQLDERIAVADLAAGRVRRTERISNLHWKLCRLEAEPGWRGEAVVVGLEERKAVVLIPQLAMETRVRRSADMQLNQLLDIALQQLDLENQEAIFRLLN